VTDLRSTETRIGPLQAGCYRRWLNLAFVFCVVVHFFWLVNACFCCVKKGSTGFPYSIPSVGPGVQAVSLQVTVSHPPGGRLPLLSARPAVTFPATEHHRPFACWQRHIGVNNCPKLLHSVALSRIWSCDLLIASPTLYPLLHCATTLLC